MKILLPIDGSEYSETAARYIRRLGFGPGTEVHVLHVLKDYLLPDSIDPARDFMKAGRAGAEALLAEYAKGLADVGAVKTHIREGEPWREIAEAADELAPDLVVLGHKGLTGIGMFLLGSVPHHVLRHVRYSVLVARELPPLDRAMRVLYCTDGSAHARHALGLFMSLPYRDDTSVSVLSVVDMDVTSMPERYYPDEDISVMMAELRRHNLEHAEKAVAEASAKLRERFRDVRERVIFGAPAPEILANAEELQADLVVLGSKGILGLRELLLGSVSQRVVKHARCGVLVAKMPEPAQ